MTKNIAEIGWLDTILLALLAIIVGVVVAYASLGFLAAIGWLHGLLVGETGASLYIYLTGLSPVYLFIIPVIGAVIVSMITGYGMSTRRNHGPADVIYAARQGNGNMSIKTGLINAVASIVSIGSGASVGRYGPVVHLGATLGAWLANKLKLAPARRKTLLACGVAGAISASFSAPLAGVVFAHEVVIGRFGIRSVMPIVISSVVATTIAMHHEVDGALFMLSGLSVAANWEYFLFAVVGAVGGGLAVLFMAMMHTFNQFAQRLPGPPVVRAVLGGMLLGAIIVVYPQTFGLGEQVVRDALMMELTVGILLTLIFAKMLATSVSFAAGFTGGVFGPALFIGAMMGTAVGLGVDALAEVASSPAVYGVAGMGAVISRVVGSPIATILIVFELTKDYYLTTAVMVSVVVANTVTQALFNHSYFYHQLRERGIEPDEPTTHQILREIPISRLVEKRKPVVVTDDATVSMVRDTIVKQNASEVYVIDHEGRLLGQINGITLLELVDKKLLSEPVTRFLSKPFIVLQAQMNVLEAFSSLKNFVGVSVPVVTNEASYRFVGVVYESTVMRTYLDAVAQSQREE